MAKLSGNYEVVFILNPNLDEEATAAMVAKFKTLGEQNGTLAEVEEWGKRHLAYPINDLTEGYYVLMTFNAKPEFPRELDRILRITDNGRGMTPERLGQVREGIRNRNACETEIYGLYNVNERIRLNFGEKYGITITSTYGEGTCVTVRLPEYTL